MSFVINKPSVSFLGRVILASKSFGFTVWLTPIALIAFPLFAFIGYRDYDIHELVFIIILGSLFVLRLLVVAFVLARNNVTSISIKGSIHVEMDKFNSKLFFELDPTDLTYLIRPRSHWQTPYFRLLKNNKVVFTQYIFNDFWSMKELELLENKLKEAGIKKTYGENL